MAKAGAKKGRPLRRFVLYLLILVLGLVFGGFLKFAWQVDHMRPPDNPPVADGIVVLTGKGGGRLETGAELLSGGYGERLLISGVNTGLERQTVIDLLPLSGELAACCVDLDYSAVNTVGNARETANWAEALGYEHILLVTSAYHMPRAELEIAAAAGPLRITPIAVSADSPAKWWSDQATFKRLAQEYGKLLLTMARQPGLRAPRNPPVLENTPVDAAG